MDGKFLEKPGWYDIKATLLGGELISLWTSSKPAGQNCTNSEMAVEGMNFGGRCIVSRRTDVIELFVQIRRVGFSSWSSKAASFTHALSIKPRMPAFVETRSHHQEEFAQRSSEGWLVEFNHLVNIHERPAHRIDQRRRQKTPFQTSNIKLPPLPDHVCIRQ